MDECAEIVQDDGDGELVKVYRVEVMVIDHDDLGEEEIKSLIENTRYPNHAISPQVAKIDGREVEWREDGALNTIDSWQDEFNGLFGEG